MRNSSILSWAVVIALAAGLLTIIYAGPAPDAAPGSGRHNFRAMRPADGDGLERDWLPKNPGDLEAWLALGDARAREGRPDDAARAWRRGAERAEAVDVEPASPRIQAWRSYRLGHFRDRLGDADAARAAWEQAIALFAESAGSGSGLKANDLYNIACCRALLGQKDEAFAALATAIESGYSDAAHASIDRDLRSLRRDPRFDEVLAPIGGRHFIVNPG